MAAEAGGLSKEGRPASAGLPQPPASPMPAAAVPNRHALSELLDAISQFKAALAIEAGPANIALHGACCELHALFHGDPAVAELLDRFGWKGLDAGFTRTVDLPGLKGALQKFKWTKVEQLGCGAFGVVHKALNREDGRYAAIKKLYSPTEQGLSAITLREVSTLRELRHDNIVRLLDIISTTSGSHVYLVLECMDCDLRRYLDRNTEASGLAKCKSIIFQILKGIRHAHANCIMHRDLKPQNILVDAKSGKVKITDFGLSRYFLPSGAAYTEKVVTLYYRAPELLLGAVNYKEAIDIWSIGCIFAELVNFEPLFKADCEIGLLYSIFEKLGTPTADIWKDLPSLAQFSDQFPRWPKREWGQLVPRLAFDEAALDLLSRMLTYDPDKRITAQDALQHEWFTADAAYKGQC